MIKIMSPDEIAKALVLPAQEFMRQEVSKKEVFLYDKDLNNKELPFALPVSRCVKVTFEFSDIPE